MLTKSSGKKGTRQTGEVMMLLCPALFKRRTGGPQISLPGGNSPGKKKSYNPARHRSRGRENLIPHVRGGKNDQGEGCSQSTFGTGELAGREKDDGGSTRPNV